MKEFYATGKRGASVCISVREYPYSVVASAESDHITKPQFAKALKKEYPNLVFYAHYDNGYIVAQADVVGTVVLSSLP